MENKPNKPRRLTAYELWSNKTYHETINDGPQWIRHQPERRYNGSSPYEIILDRPSPSGSPVKDEKSDERHPFQAPLQSDSRREGYEGKRVAKQPRDGPVLNTARHTRERSIAIPPSNITKENSMPDFRKGTGTKRSHGETAFAEVDLQAIRNDCPIPRKAPRSFRAQHSVRDPHRPIGGSRNAACDAEIDIQANRQESQIPRRPGKLPRWLREKPARRGDNGDS